jgi:hypothetical protein
MIDNNVSPESLEYFARDLERELNAANAIIRQQQLLEEENLRLQDRVKLMAHELESVGVECGIAVVKEAVATNENHKLKDRIKRLEDIISRAKNKFFRHGSNGTAASGMLDILGEVRKP